jgi:hypothetical protein
MPNVLIFFREGAPGQITDLLDACRAFAPQNLIVACCENAIRLLSQEDLDALAAATAEVILTPFEHQGDACAALLAADWIDNDCELVVAGAGTGGVDFAAMSAHFRDINCAAGLATREGKRLGGASVRLDDQGLLVEASAKGSENAAAGVFWFAHGRDLLRAVQAMIRKNPNHAGPYGICPALNELVLENRAIGVYPVEAAA